MTIILARLKRFGHGLWWSFRPWMWTKKDCRAVTHYDLTPGTSGVTLVACNCGKEFYRRPGYDETELVPVDKLNDLASQILEEENDRTP
jgi:hypothetical protein